MSIHRKNSKQEKYFSGGLAEFVSSPSPLTYSFLKDWFTGNMSLGKAMLLLGMPYRRTTIPVLELVANELVVNLEHEEKTLYQDTIFSYAKQSDIHATPKLVLKWVKLANPICIAKTIQILLVQSKWIAHQNDVLILAKQLVSAIPELPEEQTWQEANQVLQDHVWPQVIAIGLLSEFYNQLVLKEAKDQSANAQAYISSTLANDDWFFRSITDQLAVKRHKLSFEKYLEEYGLRADKDYELSCPRWHELPEKIKNRIAQATESNSAPKAPAQFTDDLMKQITTAINLQLLRSEAKRKALVHIDRLRTVILYHTQPLTDIAHLTKDDLQKNHLSAQKHQTDTPKQLNKTITLSSGKGTSVSQGIITGIIKHITDNDTTIPKGTIGIFPNASPEFAIQYPRCSGMVFLKGGQTSHGAIVAREFGIPAIIDNNLAYIPNNTILTINGETGAWHVE